MTGLRFLFRVTLRRLDLAEEVYHIREPRKLPLVMSVDETKRLLAAGKPNHRGGSRLLPFCIAGGNCVTRR
jgi:site-specific recombinase XerD